MNELINYFMGATIEELVVCILGAAIVVRVSYEIIVNKKNS